MKTIEFEATPDGDGTITIPESFKGQAAGKKLKVTLTYEDESTIKSPEHYNKGYDQKDSLYDAY